MFDSTFECKIRSVVPRVTTDKNEQIRRLTELTLQFEFDDDVASPLGDVARDALKHLRSRAQKGASILFDNVGAQATFTAGPVKHKLDMTGVRAVASQPSAEAAQPTLSAMFAFATRHEDLCWFTDHLQEVVKVKLVRKQLPLPRMESVKDEKASD